jgi:hypothetical protein
VILCIKYLYKNKTSKMIWISDVLILSVPGEGYSRNASCALNLIITLYYIPLVLRWFYLTLLFWFVGRRTSVILIITITLTVINHVSVETWAVMYLCVGGIDFASFYDLFRQCAIFFPFYIMYKVQDCNSVFFTTCIWGLVLF